jgi:hypothetical protein
LNYARASSHNALAVLHDIANLNYVIEDLTLAPRTLRLAHRRLAGYNSGTEFPMTRMSATPSSDIRCFSPFRTPDWRWSEALGHIRKRTCPGRWEDPAIAQAHQFLMALKLAHTDAGRMELSLRCPDVSAAYAVFNRGGVVKDELEARLLCQSPEEIAGATGIGADVVRAYATFFFDVLGSLNANDCLLLQAVGLYGLPSINRPNPQPPVEAYFFESLTMI